jgi:hypothetical protein
VVRNMDYNKMFNNGSDGSNLVLLEEFLNSLVKKKAKANTKYLLEKRVQEFLLIDDPQILKKIVMMSLEQKKDPISKVYTPLNIVDEY